MRRLGSSLALTVLGGVLVAAGASTAEAGSMRQSGEPTPAPQEVTGEGLYRHYCISCHGDRLRGLTAEWIAQWPATHQNCWVPKCHGLNHPPDGFTIPREAPAIAGSGALAKFRSAFDLHAYIRATMPYQEPGWLTDDQYWDIVAFVLRRHGAADLPERLNADNARAIELNPGQTQDEPAALDPPSIAHLDAAEERPPLPSRPAIALLAAVVGLAAAIALVLRRRAPRP